MEKTRFGIHFDKQDYELLQIVNDVLARAPSRKSLRTLLVPYLHPNGIKEMAAPKELRIAYALINLLDVLEGGGPEERLEMLRSVRDEVLHCARSDLRINTARVLLQIMKELVRSQNDPHRQLELAHDFRRAATGKPRIVRSQLKRYYLLEMPETWNQVTFDNHVHDANTKGRKSPTHLIMDAWIKGIRTLTVVYYNHVRQAAAAELLEAAEIMGVQVHIGIEFSARYRNRYVQLIWSPCGLSGTQEFIQFLAQPLMAELMAEGREVSDYQQRYVFHVLEAFNCHHLPDICDRLQLDVLPLDPHEFLSAIGAGQASLLHLAKFIHDRILPAMQARMARLREEYREADPDHRVRLQELVDEMNAMDLHGIQERYLCPEANPQIPNPDIPTENGSIPRLLTYSPCELTDRLSRLHASFRITLNLTNVELEDLIELLFQCGDHITHLELFNLKDHVQAKMRCLPEINELQRALNEGNVLRLKQIVRRVSERLKGSERADAADRLKQLAHVLHHIGELCDIYKRSPLGSLLGSDSTGRSTVVPGMGLALRDTLPQRAQRKLAREGTRRWLTAPIRYEAFFQITYTHAWSAGNWLNALFALARRLPGLQRAGLKRQEGWITEDSSIRFDPGGNIVSLGGIRSTGTNGLMVQEPEDVSSPPWFRWSYLNSGLKNAVMILTGFTPALLTFVLTKDWWFLAYFGAVIWFGITGLRNIIQSVLGGGGLRRSPLLRWRNYVSWDRLSESLMFTGFSVPLLDHVVKTLFLDRSLGVNAATEPLILYSVMALANGIYLSSHNILRGLPRAAVYGNLFRSLLSIPLAFSLNLLAALVLGFYGVAGVDLILQKWAAIISKSASDTVAGVIEGLADRYNNLNMRVWDYSGKLRQMFDTFTKIERLFPESDITELLSSPEEFLKTIGMSSEELGKVAIVNALDLLYFWMYQPRARTALIGILKSMSDEERRVFESTQHVLQDNRGVSQMFVDGLVGAKFGKALAFYLDRWEEYLADFHSLVERVPYRCSTVSPDKLARVTPPRH